ncbi:MAG TPA: hypothetical protein VFK10_02500 [Burkholderiaceae bacterium]|nr:hypothetical protein [Burkholderiaceae bacterium]
MNTHTLVAVAACAAALGGAAHARTMQQELNHHAAEQSRIAADELHGRLSPASAGALHERAAKVEQVEADTLAANDAASRQQLAYAERDLDHAIARAEHAKHKQQPTAGSLDRMHAQVASAREAEQQRWIAAAYRHGTFESGRAAQLERDQAAVVSHEAALERRGHESVDEALQVQHLQDVQDWAIRSGRSRA